MPAGSTVSTASKILKFVVISAAIVSVGWVCWMATLFLVIGSISQSHIDTNVPEQKDFDRELQSSLEGRFCGLSKECRIEYEFLRKGPTQSGTSYPKYYVWMRCFSEDGLKTEGAVKLAAEDQMFVVRDLLSKKEISASPEDLRGSFPVALIDEIQRRANSK